MDKRFEFTSTQTSFSDFIKVIVDKTTGVNYLYLQGGGLTVLVDADGKPIVTK